jgi:hypothetical protein
VQSGGMSMRPFDRNGLWVDLILVVGLSFSLVAFVMLPKSIDYIIHHSAALLVLVGLALFGLLAYTRRRRG